MKYYIGWDVGAWHCKSTGKGSKDALAILDEKQALCGSLWEGNLSSLILKTSSQPDATSFFIDELFKLCKVANSPHKEPGNRFWLAIDTPLGWPTAFRELVMAPSEDTNSSDADSPVTNAVVNLGNSKIHNPFLHRKTETLLGQSLSAVQDQIGSQSTKALYLLDLLKPIRESVGVWKNQTAGLTILETYPAPCMRSFEFIDRMKSISTDESITSDDKFDALVCAGLASAIATDDGAFVSQPCEDCDVEEGWIFAPQRCLPASGGISYGKLIGSQSPPKSLAELLSQIQVGLVLKNALRANTVNPLVDEWLEQKEGSDAIFQKTNPVGLRALFNLLHPKAKKVPSDSLLEATAKSITAKLNVSEAKAT